MDWSERDTEFRRGLTTVVIADCRRAALHLCGGDAKTERNHAGQGAALCDKCGTDCAARISSVTEHMEAEHMER
eukprot:1699608-Rhodomonas_salina.3